MSDSDTEQAAHDVAHMRRAICAAREATRAGDMPFGAVLARGDTELFVARNEQHTGADCTAHAEVVLIRRAAAALGATALIGTTVYASGEPCAMCAGAMFWAGIARIVFAATTDDIERALGGSRLPIRCAAVLATARPSVLVEGPLLHEEGVAALVLPEG